MQLLRFVLLTVCCGLFSGQFVNDVLTIGNISNEPAMSVVKEGQTYTFETSKVLYQSSSQINQIEPEIPIDGISRDYSYTSTKNCIIFPIHKETGNITAQVDKTSCLAPIMVITIGYPEWTITPNKYVITPLFLVTRIVFTNVRNSSILLLTEPYISTLFGVLYSINFTYSMLVNQQENTYFSIFCIAYTSQTNQALKFSLAATPRIANQNVTYSSISDLEQDNNILYVPFKSNMTINLPQLEDTTKFYFNTSAIPDITYVVFKDDGTSSNQTYEFTLDSNGRYKIQIQNNGTTGIWDWMLTQPVKSASSLGIILGSVFGVIGFIIIVVIVVLIIRHFLRNRYPHANEAKQDPSPTLDNEHNVLNQSSNRRSRLQGGRDEGIIVVTLDPSRRRKPDTPNDEFRNNGSQAQEQPKPSKDPSIQQVQSEVREVKF